MRKEIRRRFYPTLVFRRQQFPMMSALKNVFNLEKKFFITAMQYRLNWHLTINYEHLLRNEIPSKYDSFILLLFRTNKKQHVYFDMMLTFI